MSEGLDKAKRVADAAKVRATDAKVEPLNLPWPFVVVPFDPEFFGIGADLPSGK